MTPSDDPKRDLLRHCIATIAYRGGKMLRGTTPSYGDFVAHSGVRAPRQLLAHIGDLMEWALNMSQGQQQWHASEPGPWEAEQARFHETLKRLDDFLSSDAPLRVSPENLMQGPITDALTHIGQLAMLRRMADAPVKSENYFIAGIQKGRVGSDQATPKFEF